jgi:hypothetical protein
VLIDVCFLICLWSSCWLVVSWFVDLSRSYFTEVVQIGIPLSHFCIFLYILILVNAAKRHFQLASTILLLINDMNIFIFPQQMYHIFIFFLTKTTQWIPLCDKVCQWFATGRWFSPDTPVCSTNKTYRREITEILLKMAFSSINQNQYIKKYTEMREGNANRDNLCEIWPWQVHKSRNHQVHWFS